jgi:hypothetical protein
VNNDPTTVARPLDIPTVIPIMSFVLNPPRDRELEADELLVNVVSLERETILDG